MNKTIFSKLLCSLIIAFAQFILITPESYAAHSHYISLLKEMFLKVTVEKKAQAIPLYYDKDFKSISNGQSMSFEEFLKMHQAIYKTPIKYNVRYDEETLIEQGNKVAGRLYITTKLPKEKAKEIEVLLIAEYKNNKLYRMSELTYPEWSKMKAFQKVSR